MHILLVEDNLGDARLIREMLRDMPGFTLTHVSRLSEALNIAHEVTCDLVLLDLSLPDSSGVETVTRVKEHLPRLPLVVLTGSDDEQTGMAAVTAGAQDYLIKGETDRRILQRSLQYARERHRAEESLRSSEQAYRSLIDDVFDTSMVGVLILDRQFQVVWMNEAIEIYFGVEREDIVGQDKRVLIDSKLKCIFADPDDYSSRLLSAYEAGDFTDRFECHVTKAETRDERWLEHWSQPIRHGLYAGGRIEQYTDITDRKIAEFAEAEQRRFAEALHSTAIDLTSTLEMDTLLDRILHSVDRIIPNDAANVVLIEQDELYTARSIGRRVEDADALDAALNSLATAPVFEVMRHARKPLMIRDLGDSPHLIALASQADMRSYAGAPIILQNHVIGFLNIFCHQPGCFSDDAADRLDAFAAQAAVAIQNARLYQRSRELAAVQERQRLARELHDSVSQTLFSAQTLTDAGLRQLANKPDKARGLFQEVYHQLANALAEMRILLLELRPSALTQVGLKQLFEQYLRATLANQSIEVEFEIEEIPLLPGDVQIALYRIVQEAVNNVVKHAGASRVTVRATQFQDVLVLSVEDDGCGFSNDDARPTNLGLNIMRERAEQIGAAIRIESTAGQGTQVVVTWMMNENKQRS
jgi:signal transduction histidine kinase/DNA-binding response OmpR family regulator